MALILSWSIWVPMALDHLGMIDFKVPIIIGQSLGGIAPLISLIILDKSSKGALGMKSIFDSIRIRGEKLIWLIPAALILPLATISGNLLSSLIMNEGEFNILAIDPLKNLGFWLIGIIPLTFFAALLSSPLFEEPCWRGFGLNQLQRRFGRLIGSLFVGTFWWIWHQPINIANGMEANLYSYLIMLSHSFTIDSIYNLSHRNLLSAMFTHSSIIITYNYIFRSQNIYVLVILLIVVVILRILEWQNKPDNNFPILLKKNQFLKNNKNKIKE